MALSEFLSMKNVFSKKKIINNKCDRKWRLAHVPREPARTRHPTGRTVSAPTKIQRERMIVWCLRSKNIWKSLGPATNRWAFKVEHSIGSAVKLLVCKWRWGTAASRRVKWTYDALMIFDENWGQCARRVASNEIFDYFCRWRLFLDFGVRAGVSGNGALQRTLDSTFLGGRNAI